MLESRRGLVLRRGAWYVPWFSGGGCCLGDWFGAGSRGSAVAPSRGVAAARLGGIRLVLGLAAAPSFGSVAAQQRSRRSTAAVGVDRGRRGGAPALLGLVPLVSLDLGPSSESVTRRPGAGRRGLRLDERALWEPFPLFVRALTVREVAGQRWRRPANLPGACRPPRVGEEHVRGGGRLEHLVARRQYLGAEHPPDYQRVVLAA